MTNTENLRPVTGTESLPFIAVHNRGAVRVFGFDLPDTAVLLSDDGNVSRVPIAELALPHDHAEVVELAVTSQARDRVLSFIHARDELTAQYADMERTGLEPAPAAYHARDDAAVELVEYLLPQLVELLGLPYDV